ncbi:cysteine peptidase family C39 domain-containing protein [Methanobacterium paludis]|uniref:Peptidase C39 bacteriocin processing n=1 Tax=Methanobacterium paludis (strain DSM 25820 / JCM 18151 / SWAN1) TaxID=868131 RepID=F6D2A4_METPW|nr:cysteine peptidase family C39 domain-containing protein [Methanobacterium paludis]AEG18621.1 peptidase C39 bacteriocin processing [Methanobacterium paludis]
MSIRINKAQLLDGANGISNFIKANKRFPNYATLTDSNNKQQKVLKANYLDFYKRAFQWAVNHGDIFPNYGTVIGTGTSPIPQNYQDSSTTCGPTSLSMGSCGLFKYKSEAQFKAACNTTSSGTTPENLIAGAAKLGFKLTKISRNIAGVKAALNQCKPVIAHIQTKNATCLGYKGDYGHYVLIKGLSGDDHYLINDPTKGENITCLSTILDNATDGREIYYYSMELA